MLPKACWFIVPIASTQNHLQLWANAYDENERLHRFETSYSFMNIDNAKFVLITPLEGLGDLYSQNLKDLDLVD